MSYYATHQRFAIWDSIGMKMLKKRDVTFWEHILGHPIMSQFGMTPGHNILGEEMVLTDGEPLELVSASDELELDQLDVVSAFLNGEIDTEVFLHQPEGFRLGIEYFCKLHKSIYGLCQGARS